MLGILSFDATQNKTFRDTKGNYLLLNFVESVQSKYSNSPNEIVSKHNTMEVQYVTGFEINFSLRNRINKINGEFRC